MIEITKKDLCCGCASCESVCPKQCISLVSDQEGFLYPEVKKDVCINCGLCEKVCPFLSIHEPKKPIEVYAAKNLDDHIRSKSSSGGVFTALGEATLLHKGVVVGAAFDKVWDVRHIFIERKDDLIRNLGSKYVQSNIEGVFRKIKDILITNRIVLFSGTPCQVNGLKNYLRTEYSNLICVEVACHGVPSPLIWKDYLQSEKPVNKDFSSISFRDKRRGWLEYGMRMVFDDGSEKYQNRDSNLYLKGYLTNTFIRPSCYNCPSKKGRSGADIALGDYWGVDNYHHDIYDNKGVSLVLVYTTKGKEIFEKLNIEYVKSSYEYAKARNNMLEVSTPRPEDREMFWEEYLLVGLKAVRSAISRRRPNIYNRFKCFVLKVLSTIKRTFSLGC